MKNVESKIYEAYERTTEACEENLKKLRLSDGEFDAAISERDANENDENQNDAFLKMLEFFDHVNLYAACTSIMATRVIKNKAHFPMIHDKIAVDDLLSPLKIPKFIGITPESVQKNIFELLANTTLLSVDDGIKTFTLVPTTAKSGKLLHARVTYNPMNDETEAENFFASRFLSPLDMIIKFIEYDFKVEQGRMEAHVLIELGTTRTSSFKVTAGKLREKLQVELENWNWMKAEIPLLQKEINHYKDRLDEHPTYKKGKREKEEILNRCQQIVRVQQEVIAENSKLPENSYVSDMYDMVCRVRYNDSYCSLWHIITHSFKECRARRCLICESRQHPAKSCRYKCPCGGKPHARDFCTNSAAVQRTYGARPNLPLLEQTKATNMANTQRFFVEIDTREQQKNSSEIMNYQPTEQTATTQISSGQHSAPSSNRKMNIPINSANAESAQIMNTSGTPGFGRIYPASTHERLNILKNTEYNSLVSSNAPPSNDTSMSSAGITVSFLNRVGQIPAANHMGEESFVATDVDDPQVQETLREASDQRDMSSWALPRRSARIVQREEISGNTNTLDDNQSMESSEPDQDAAMSDGSRQNADSL